MDEREKLEKKLLDIREEERELKMKISEMARKPVYDTSYSVVKLEGWQTDLERLQERETEIRVQLNELLNSPAYLKKVEEKVSVLVVKRDELVTELEKTKSQLAQAKYDAVDKFLSSLDALKLVNNQVELEEKAKVLFRAVQLVNEAISKVSN